MTEKDEAAEKPKTIKEKIRAATLAKAQAAIERGEVVIPQGKPGPVPLYSPEVAEDICRQISEGNKSLSAICAEHGIDRDTFYKWVWKNEELAALCVRARLLQADSFFDNIMVIGKKIELGEIDPHAGKVLISSLEWMAERRNPLAYGAPSQAVKADNPGNGAISRMSTEELQMLRSRLIGSPSMVIEAEAQEVDKVKGTDQPTEK